MEEGRGKDWGRQEGVQTRRGGEVSIGSNNSPLPHKLLQENSLNERKAYHTILVIQPHTPPIESLLHFLKQT